VARFQTKLAELLDTQAEQLPPHVSFSWRSLSDVTDISVQTLQEWYQAKVGSEFYLERISGDVLGKLMNYFGVEQIDGMIVIVMDGEEDSPHGFQEAASAALVAV
jgi:hypothetical protein